HVSVTEDGRDHAAKRHDLLVERVVKGLGGWHVLGTLAGAHGSSPCFHVALLTLGALESRAVGTRPLESERLQTREGRRGSRLGPAIGAPTGRRRDGGCRVSGAQRKSWWKQGQCHHVRP